MRIQTEAWSFDVTFEARSAILELTPALAEFYDYQQATETFIGSLIFGYQLFLSAPLAPSVVRLVYSRSPSKNQRNYEKLLGCPVEFSRNRSPIILDRKSLGSPIGTADDRLLRILQSYCEQVLSQHKPAPSDLLARTRQTIVDLLPAGRAKAKIVASELGMNEPTMHRRLTDEGSNFTAVHDRLRRDLAEKYLRYETLSLQKIAFLLGYADQSAFSVAFRRWTGRSPKEFRLTSS